MPSAATARPRKVAGIGTSHWKKCKDIPLKGRTVSVTGQSVDKTAAGRGRYPRSQTGFGTEPRHRRAAEIRCSSPSPAVQSASGEAFNEFFLPWDCQGADIEDHLSRRNRPGDRAVRRVPRGRREGPPGRSDLPSARPSNPASAARGRPPDPSTGTPPSSSSPPDSTRSTPGRSACPSRPCTPTRCTLRSRRSSAAPSSPMRR